MLATLSQYWTGPISNTVIILGGILLLYPIVWRLSTKQIYALIQAIEIAKSLPATIDKITSASDELMRINNELSTLDAKLKVLNEINAKLIVVNRNIVDLQQINESQLPVLASETSQAPATTSNQLSNWEYVSETWQHVKIKIESLIDSLTDGRRRGKYDSMSRYKYVDVGRALVADGLLTAEQADALKRLDDLFRRVKNQRVAVTKEMKNNFERDSAIILAL